MKKAGRAFFLSFLLMVMATNVVQAKTLLVVYPFCPDDLKNEATILFELLDKMTIENYSIENTKQIGSIDSFVKLSNEDSLSVIKKTARKRKNDYILFFEMSHSVGQIFIESKLYSNQEEAFIATSFDWAYYHAIADIVKTIETKISLVFQSKIIKITNVSTLPDSTANQITIHCEIYGDNTSFAFVRSLFREGPYDTIATITTSSCADNDVIPGIVYWYRVQALYNNVVIDTSQPVSACIQAENKENLDLQKVLSLYKNPEEKPLDDEQKETIKKHVELLQPLYINSVKLRIIMQVVKSYINKGQLIVLRNFDAAVMDTDNKCIYFIKKNSYVVKLESKKPFNLLAASNFDLELLQRLSCNAIALGVPDDYIEITDDEGYTMQLPLYQAIGIATTYFTEYKHWASNTIMWNTSNKELKEKMKDYTNQ